jgi:hypothetical protein
MRPLPQRDHHRWWSDAWVALSIFIAHPVLERVADEQEVAGVRMGFWSQWLRSFSCNQTLISDW